MKKLTLFLIVIVSLFSENYYDLPTNEFNNIILNIQDDLEFKENGVRVTYKEKDKEHAFEKLKNKIYEVYNEDITNMEDNIEIELENKIIKIQGFMASDYLNMDIQIINNDKNRNINNLMKEINKLLDKKTNEIKYYSYIKGKTNSIEESVSIVNDKFKSNNIKSIDIHGGKVFTGTLSNGEKLNFVANKYDTGCFLIIGTPIIYTTF